MGNREDFEEFKYQYEKALRNKEALVKNFERRKKLNLLGSDEEYSLKKDIEDAGFQAESLKRKMRAAESQMARSKIISESGEKSPWE